jgi:hypothetical protein
VHREGGLRDSLPDLKDLPALAALILVGGHECRLHWRVEGVNKTGFLACDGLFHGRDRRLCFHATCK